MVVIVLTVGGEAREDHWAPAFFQRAGHQTGTRMADDILGLGDGVFNRVRAQPVTQLIVPRPIVGHATLGDDRCRKDTLADGLVDHREHAVELVAVGADRDQSARPGLRRPLWHRFQQDRVAELGTRVRVEHRWPLHERPRRQPREHFARRAGSRHPRHRLHEDDLCASQAGEDAEWDRDASTGGNHHARSLLAHQFRSLNDVRDRVTADQVTVILGQGVDEVAVCGNLLGVKRRWGYPYLTVRRERVLDVLEQVNVTAPGGHQVEGRCR